MRRYFGGNKIFERRSIIARSLMADSAFADQRTYVYNGNWKLQMENGADGYHVTATHWNYAATTSRRSTGAGRSGSRPARWAR